jgi:hypothetical protein
MESYSTFIKNISLASAREDDLILYHTVDEKISQ